jgi:hypothetical protein
MEMFDTRCDAVQKGVNIPPLFLFCRTEKAMSRYNYVDPLDTEYDIDKSLVFSHSE